MDALLGENTGDLKFEKTQTLKIKQCKQKTMNNELDAINAAAEKYISEHLNPVEKAAISKNWLTNHLATFAAQFKAEQSESDAIESGFEEKIMKLSEKDKDGDTWVETRNVFALFRTAIKQFKAEQSAGVWVDVKEVDCRNIE